MIQTIKLPASVRRRRAIRQIHRWLGLIVGLQLLLWVFGGLTMSALRLESVRGEDYAAPAALPLWTADTLSYTLTDAIRDFARSGVSDGHLTQLLGRPVYRLQTAEGVMTIDAQSAQALSPLPEDLARQIALDDYSGPGALNGLSRVETATTETRGRELPLWRAQFDDRRNTTLYISPQTGTVVARRNDLWRAFDFVWMLHVMDYRQRENFNHPLLIGAAASSLLFMLSGGMMLCYSFRARQRGTGGQP